MDAQGLERGEDEAIKGPPGDGAALSFDRGSYTNLYMPLKFIEHTYAQMNACKNWQNPKNICSLVNSIISV